MKFKLYALLILLAFLFVSYWFIAHSFVFVRLSAVLGLVAFVGFIALIIAFMSSGGKRG